MKTTGKYSGPFTAKEVVEILQVAKSLGVVSIKLEGFEASWELTNVSHSEERPDRPQTEYPQPYMNGETQCNVCGAEMIPGKWGPYCRKCYLAAKEQRFRSSGRW